MKLARLLALVNIISLGTNLINAKLSRAAHTQKETAAKAKINTARSKIAKATPITAAPVLQEIKNLKKQVQTDIRALAGWPSAQKRVQSALEGLDSWIPQLDKKIKQEKKRKTKKVRFDDAPQVRVFRESEVIEPSAEDILLNKLETHILPRVLESFSLENQVSQRDKEMRFKRIYQIAPPEFQATVQKLSLRNRPIPSNGEFSQAAQKELLDWIDEARSQNSEREYEYLQNAIINIDRVLDTSKRLAPQLPTNIDEDAAKALFLARLIRESRKRIMSLIEDIELE